MAGIPAADYRPPPRTNAGPLAWLRANLFSSWGNAFLTVLAVWLAYRVI